MQPAHGSQNTTSDDPKAAAAASAAQAVLSYIQSLPPAAEGPMAGALLSAQTKQEQQITATLRSAIAASPCISGLTPPGASTTLATGSVLSAMTPLTTAAGGTPSANVQVTVQALQPFPAIAIENVSSNSLAIASLTIAYSDGTTRSIGFGSSPGDGTTTPFSPMAQIGSNGSLVVDVDDRAIASITLVGAALDCPQPEHSTAPCPGSVKVVGLAAGSGLSP